MAACTTAPPSRGGRGPAGCVLAQPDFATESASNNLIFRIPTPVFGAGLIEQIPDSAILANQAAQRHYQATARHQGPSEHRRVGADDHGGHEQQRQRRNDRQVRVEGPEPDAAAVLGRGLQRRDGHLERAVPAGARARLAVPIRHCLPMTSPTLRSTTTPAGLSAIEKFAFFQRFLAPPTPSPEHARRRDLDQQWAVSSFMSTGCALCHTPMLTTGNSTVAALRNQPVNLFSDLLRSCHGTGPGRQHRPGRSAGRRVSNRTAVGSGAAHLLPSRRANHGPHRRRSRRTRARETATFGPSEANAVIDNFNKLPERTKQDLLVPLEPAVETNRPVLAGHRHGVGGGHSPTPALRTPKMSTRSYPQAQRWFHDCRV